MIGTINEYIVAYKDLHDQAPNNINFDKAGPQLDFYNGLLTHISCQFDMTHCKNLQNVFLEGKHSAQNSDNPHATNKQKKSPTARKDSQPNKQNNQTNNPHPQGGNCTTKVNQINTDNTSKEELDVLVFRLLLTHITFSHLLVWRQSNIQFNIPEMATKQYHLSHKLLLITGSSYGFLTTLMKEKMTEQNPPTFAQY
ncbi:hypothetical protein DSO57_1015505 [Entomophthora muscae]|uniref:Uncharacterized protein n=1 Tax=Entomophthora muscae TaxID=34485 RepID=A0ACC2USA3_9FUNG|nr:hypothetical protein DSO57_1015505 [Entomophthora muscae]